MMVLYESKFQNINIVSLLTTVELPHNRISMHHVHASLIELQAMRLKLPLHKVYVSENPSAQEYNDQISATLIEYKNTGIRHIAYGDLHLEEIKNWRQAKNQEIEVESLFPLWKKDTKTLAYDFLKAGFKAIVVCVNAKYLSGDFVGREFNEAFLEALPQDVDPCGENGEFHTFVYGGPLFSKDIDVDPGERFFKNLDPEGKNPMIDSSFWYVPLNLNYT